MASAYMVLEGLKKDPTYSFEKLYAEHPGSPEQFATWIVEVAIAERGKAARAALGWNEDASI